MSPTTRTRDRQVSSEDIYLARGDNADDVIQRGDNDDDIILVSSGTSWTERTKPSTTRTARTAI